VFLGLPISQQESQRCLVLPELGDGHDSFPSLPDASLIEETEQRSFIAFFNRKKPVAEFSLSLFAEISALGPWQLNRMCVVLRDFPFRWAEYGYVTDCFLCHLFWI